MPASAESQLDRLNLVDRLVLAGDGYLRRLGLPGLPSQYHVWLRGRLDLERLQATIDRLVRCWPLLTARLVRKPFPAWRLSGEPTCPLQVAPVDSDGEEDVLRAAESFLARPFDLGDENPVRFHVVRRPGGNDVLIVQYAHVLMDGHGGRLLVERLVDPSLIPDEEGISTATDMPDRLLREVSLGERLRALRKVGREQRAGKAISLPAARPPRANPSPGRISLRWIEPRTVEALEDRLRRLGMRMAPSVAGVGFSLAFTASGFRTLHRRLPQPPAKGSVYEMHLPYQVRTGQHEAHHPFHNHAARVTLRARPDELDDWEGLVNRLNEQVMQQMTAASRLGLLQGAAVVESLSRRLPWLTRLVEPRGRSLRATYWPDLFAPGQSAYEAAIEFSFGSTVCPANPGVSADVFRIGPRLLACCMHHPDTLTDKAAARFFDDWLADLSDPMV